MDKLVLELSNKIKQRGNVKMKKIMMIFGMVSISAFVFAQEVESTTIEATASKPEVKSVLESDGVAIKQQPDGSFQIFARGTGTYDFGDPEDIQDATNDAVLKAKAAIAKFMSEQLTTEQGFERASQKTSQKTKDGDNVTKKISKDSVKTSTEMIKNNASELLRGVVVLKIVKQSSEPDSGVIQATVGVSSKTLKAANRVQSKFRNPISSTREKSPQTDRVVPVNENKIEVFINDTDF